MNIDILTLLKVLSGGIVLLRTGLNAIRDRQLIGERIEITTENGDRIKGKVANIGWLNNRVTLRTDWGDRHVIKDEHITDFKIFSNRRVRVINKMDCDVGFAIASNSIKEMSQDDINDHISKTLRLYCSSHSKQPPSPGEMKYSLSKGTLRGFILYIGNLKPESMQYDDSFEVPEEESHLVLPDMRCYGEKRKINTQEFLTMFKDLYALQTELVDKLKEKNYFPSSTLAVSMHADVPGYYEFFNDIAKSMGNSTAQVSSYQYRE